MPRRREPPRVIRQYVSDPDRCAAALVKLLFYTPPTDVPATAQDATGGEAPPAAAADQADPAAAPEAIALEEMLADALETLARLLEALTAWQQSGTNVNHAHLQLVAREARGLLTRPDIDAFLTGLFPESGPATLLALVVDYLATTDDPERYFGADAPERAATLMAAVRWGVSEGRLTLADAERIQALGAQAHWGGTRCPGRLTSEAQSEDQSAPEEAPCHTFEDHQARRGREE